MEKVDKFLWPIADLERQIKTKGLDYDCETLAIRKTCSLLELLHKCALESGILNLPAPMVEFNSDIGLELTWFYKLKGRVLTFAMNGRNIFVFIMNNNESTTINTTDKDKIISLLKWVYGAVIAF